MKLFKKPKSKYYWYDFTVRSQRYRGSTNETKASRAAKIAGLKLAQAVDNTDPLPKKAPVLLEFSGASWNGWTLPDSKPRQRPITAMAGGS